MNKYMILKESVSRRGELKRDQGKGQPGAGEADGAVQDGGPVLLMAFSRGFW